MHNPAPYVGINSAEPKYWLKITGPTLQVTTSLHRVVGPYLVLMNYLSGFHMFYYTHFEITGDPCNLIGSQ